MDDRQQPALWLDLDAERLWRGTEVLRLRPKSFAVLRYLAAQAGRVVPKKELLQVVWLDTTVSNGALMVCMNELRTALGDTVQAPQYIETVPRRGYRWIGPCLTVAQPPSAAPRLPHAASGSPLVVGREAVCAQLHAWMVQAQQGTRQVGFLTGPAGIGKTTVIDAFMAQVAREPNLWLVRGQCIDHYGAGEAYLPVLEALGQLCRGPDSERVVATLTQYAPNWLVQMPALLSTAALEAVQRRVLGTTRERMLRELAEAVEVLTSERLLVLVLEALHWSDTATRDLVASLARRRGPARLLLLGTYRSEAGLVPEHPVEALALDLQLAGQGMALRLQGLTAEDVTAYLAARLGTVPDGLAAALYRRTDGHPLFLVTVVDALVQQGVLQEVAGRWELMQELAAVEASVPETLRQLIAHQFHGLPSEDQDVLEAASVAGRTYTVAAVAAGIGVAVEAVEARCAGLARRGQFLQAHGVEEWPDGTLTGRYRFQHTLVQQVIYEQIQVARRLRLHQRIGVQLEAGYGAQTGGRAAELALHFDRGRDLTRAVHYSQQAATNALRRAAYAEALAHLRHALELLQMLPDTPTRCQQELECCLALGLGLMATQGPAAPEVGQTYARAQTLCAQGGTPLQHFRALEGLRQCAVGRGEYRQALALGTQCLEVAQGLADPVLLTQAYTGLGTSTFFLGKFATSQAHLAQGLRYSKAQPQAGPVTQYRHDPGVLCHTYGAWVRWFLGYPDQAIVAMQQALTRAQALASPMILGWALGYAAVLYLLRGEAPDVQAHTEALLTLATDYGLAAMVPQLALRGWILVAQGQREAGLAHMRQGLDEWQATGQEPGRLLFLVLLAEQYGHMGQAKAGLHVLAEPLADPAMRGQRPWEAELYRVQGTLLRATDQHAEAVPWLQQALDTARRQQAKSLELRAAIALSRLWQQQGQGAAARALLAEVYGWFTEGFDTADLQEAKALLEALA